MSVDETVRAALHDPQLALPAWPDAVDRVHAGIRRRRGRRTVGLGVATAVTLALALPLGTKLATTGRPQTASAVPTASPSDEIRAATTPCVSRQLLASLSPGSVSGVSIVVMTNQGAGRCTLADWPVLVTTAATGQVQIVPVVNVPADSVADEQVPATIEPGEHAYATVVTSLTCQGGQDPTSYTNLAVALDGGEVPLRGSQLVTTCPVQISPWYRIVGKG